MEVVLVIYSSLAIATTISFAIMAFVENAMGNFKTRNKLARLSLMGFAWPIGMIFLVIKLSRWSRELSRWSQEKENE